MGWWCLIGGEFGRSLRPIRPPAHRRIAELPKWSADGNYIAVEVWNGELGRLEIVVVNVQSGDVVNLGGGVRPIWSPTGDRICVPIT